MKNKFLSRIMLTTLCAALLLSGCSNSEADGNSTSSGNPAGSTVNSGSSLTNGNNMPSYAATISVADIKNAYGETSSSDIMPLYNVLPSESFDFDFKADYWDEFLEISPEEMITVHTDPSCSEESEIPVYRDMNEGENGGTRVTVSPITSVLETDSEVQNMLENDVEVWGNAAMYYIAVRYDMESETAAPLDTPKIIPFTVKHELAVPTLKGEVDSTGRFKLTWNEVPGADSYNIYVYRNDGTWTGYDNSPVAGAENAFQGSYLVKDTSTTETEFDNFAGDGHGLAISQRSVSGEEYVLGQNYSVCGSYFVTAVFGDQESSLSNIVNTSDLILPFKPVEEDDIMMERFDDESKLPQRMRVLNIDGSVTERNITYSFFWGTSYLAYETDLEEVYSIPEYQYKVEGTAITGYVIMEQENAAELYKDKQVGDAPSGFVTNDIDTSTKIEPENNTKFNPDSDVPTIIEDEPTSEPEEKSIIERQVENTEKHIENGNQETVENSDYIIFADSAEEEWIARNLAAGNEQISIEAFPNLQQFDMLSDVLQKVYFQNPYVLGVTSYEYDYGSLTLFVNYCYNKEEIAQKQAEIKSAADKIISDIITENMSDEEKCKAIYCYFNENTRYDNDAVEAAAETNYKKTESWKDNEDSFNAYGIIVNQKGVCQSYALSYKLLCTLCGVESKVITGYLDGNLPHAWNAVKLDNEWYQTDCTNNETNCGIPFFLYEAGYDMLSITGYTEDNAYELDVAVGLYAVTQSDREYYTANGLSAKDIDEYKKVLGGCLESDGNIVVRFTGESISQEGVVKAVKEVYNMKGMEDKLYGLGLAYSNGYIILVNR